MKRYPFTALMLAGLCAAAGAQAVGEPVSLKPVVRNWSVALSTTRVIYDLQSRGEEVTVTNPNDYPVLVQSGVTEEDKKTPAPYLVTPPLFRLEAGQRSRIRVVRTGGPAPAGRETLSWLCVTGIPPEQGDAWAGHEAPQRKAAELDVNVRLSRCIKLLLRPAGLSGGPEAQAGRVTWRRKGNTLEATNPTPFYMNLSSLSVGGKGIPQPGYIPPSGEAHWPLPANAAGPVQWRVITDIGSQGAVQRAPLP